MKHYSPFFDFLFHVINSHDQTHDQHININMIMRSQEKNLNQNRDSNLGPPDF